MKNIFKYLFFFSFAFAIVSCDNEDQEQLTITAKAAGEITSPSSGSSFILNPEETQTNPILTINWNAADYGVPTGISYKIEIAKAGTSFEKPIVVSTTSNTYLTLNITELNGAAIAAGLNPFIKDAVEIRITSTVGSLGSIAQISGSISINLTPFTTDLPTIGIPGNHQGWNDKAPTLLAASGFGKTDYVGYAWLDGGHKILAPNAAGGFAWGNTDWGWDGTTVGTLVEKDEKDLTAVKGYYYVEVDTQKLTYKETPVSWGIIGEATPTGWDSDTDLVYDSATKTLSVVINMVNGKGWKFRGNNEWGKFEFGTVNADGFLQAGGDFTFDQPTGKYKIVLDLSKPREYTYTATPN